MFASASPMSARWSSRSRLGRNRRVSTLPHNNQVNDSTSPGRFERCAGGDATRGEASLGASWRCAYTLPLRSSASAGAWSDTTPPEEAPSSSGARLQRRLAGDGRATGAGGAAAAGSAPLGRRCADIEALAAQAAGSLVAARRRRSAGMMRPCHLVLCSTVATGHQECWRPLVWPLDVDPFSSDHSERSTVYVAVASDPTRYVVTHAGFIARPPANWVPGLRLSCRAESAAAELRFVVRTLADATDLQADFVTKQCARPWTLRRHAPVSCWSTEAIHRPARATSHPRT